MQGFFFARFFTPQLALALASPAFGLYNHSRYGNGLNKRPIGFILLSSGFFGLSTPLAKILLRDLSPLVLSGLLDFGALLGLTIYALLSRLVRPWPDTHHRHAHKENS